LFFPSLDFTTLSQKQSVFHQKGLIGVIKFVLNAHFVNLMFSPQAQDQWGRCSQLKFGAKEKDKTAKPWSSYHTQRPGGLDSFFAFGWLQSSSPKALEPLFALPPNPDINEK
jgi:hypothetical protein